ncbi:hypothetical protein [Paenibacillus sp. S150]|uniref:hypothetical protein n=1 Tax=Paenibacillus sp. S150 TaxID=2749826 RepID=UPI001C59BD8D|nr:hypothetical protein [Paenibacillus sp. S150]MBW4085246.1 hypothetical protein [Paenibacillus sp. S150]
MPQPETSIWGTILTCVEIGLHIYAMQAERNNGLVLDADYAKEALSEEALKWGDKQGEHIYFDDVKSVVPAYELAQQGAITHPELSELAEHPEKLAMEGKYFAPEYFGEFAPPQDTTWKSLSNLQALCNGIYFVDRDSQPMLAVHQTIGEQVLSEMAVHVSSGQGEYLLYSLDRCAIPVFELSASHPAVLAQVVDEASLLHTLCDDHPEYVGMHNLHTEEWGHIHDQPAPKSLFLQRQLDQAANQELQLLGQAEVYTHQEMIPTLQAREAPEDFFEPANEEMEW